MIPRTTSFFALVGIACLALAPPLGAELEFLGEEYRVNAGSSSTVTAPLVTFDRGRYLVVWEDVRSGVVGRFLRHDGVPLGRDLALVESDPVTVPFRGVRLVRKDPAVVFDETGEFFLFWTEEEAFLYVDAFFYQRQIRDQDIFGQRFDRGGNPAGERFRVNTSTGGFQSRPRVAATGGGTLLIVWQRTGTELDDGDGIVGRLLDRAGAPLGGEFRVDDLPGPAGRRPGVAASPAGGALVVWEGSGLHEEAGAVFGRLFAGSGEPRGLQFQINTRFPGSPSAAAVVGDPNGGFVIVWQGRSGEIEEGRRAHRVFGQVVGADGNLLGGEFVASAGFGWGHTVPVLTARPTGDLLLSWIVWSGPFRVGVFARELAYLGGPFDTGPPEREPLRINAGVMAAENTFSVVPTRRGDFLVVWVGFDADGERGVFARFLSASPLARFCSRLDPLAVSSARFTESCSP